MTTPIARPESPATRLLRWSAAALAGFAWIVITGWLVGRIVSDRFLWSQFLLWIPTPVTLAFIALGLMASFRPGSTKRRRKRRQLVWGGILVAMAFVFFFVENRFHRMGTPERNGLQVMHWTMSHAKRPRDAHIKKIEQLVGDVNFLSEAWGMNWPEAMDTLLGPEGKMARAGRYWILSTIKIIEARTIISRDGVEISLVQLDATEQLGRVLIVYLVDLPSSPTVGRAAQAKSVRRLLNTLTIPRPDMIVGDFNTPRGSRSLSILFPGLHHAYDDAGRGYGASFHRAFPLYHIDHMLLAHDMQATSYELIDPGMGRHDVQVATVKGKR
ncbi:MAG: hypothetical protein IID30_15670 [Planctomycetes bacterium]|nr:hypothetical protein [Planctomycetota bacterium]